MAKQRWQNVDSPKTVFAIARAGDVGWMLGTSEGIWRLVNGACSILTETLRPAAITAVAASNEFPLHQVALAGATDGIARSTDEGMTWVGATMQKTAQIAQIAVSPQFRGDGQAFAATFADGVLCTTDFGATWQSWNYGLLDMETVAISISPSFATDDTVLVATVHGVFRSTNGGHAWRELIFPKESLPPSGMAFASGLLLVGSESQGLLYSFDVGDSWGRRASFKSGQINCVAASHDGKQICVATPSVVAHSSDQGLNWIRTDGHTPDGIISLAIADDGALMCGTQDSGLWVYV